MSHKQVPQWKKKNKPRKKKRKKHYGDGWGEFSSYKILHGNWFSDLFLHSIVWWQFLCHLPSWVVWRGSLLLQEGKCLNYEVPNSPSLWSPWGLLSAQGSTALKCINVTLQDYQNSFGIALSWRSCLQLTVWGYSSSIVTHAMQSCDTSSS